MDITTIEKEIEQRIKERKKGVLNRNALRALFSCFSDPVGSLGSIFIGRHDALSSEKLQIQQELILDLLCGIDEVLTQAQAKASANGIDWTAISGTIESHAEHADSVTGVHIGQGAGPVELKPGSHIRASATSANQVTGLKIGGKESKEGS